MIALLVFIVFDLLVGVCLAGAYLAHRRRLATRVHVQPIQPADARDIADAA